MILSYSKDRFKDLILSGHKKHTLRSDKNNRWKVGMKIQHWRGNPRNRHNANYHVHEFATGVVKGIEEVELVKDTRAPLGFEAYVNEIELTTKQKLDLLKNDGFDNEKGFRAWFFKDSDKWVGRIIHFTDDIRYNNFTDDAYN